MDISVIKIDIVILCFNNSKMDFQSSHFANYPLTNDNQMKNRYQIIHKSINSDIYKLCICRQHPYCGEVRVSLNTQNRKFIEIRGTDKSCAVAIEIISKMYSV